MLHVSVIVRTRNVYLYDSGVMPSVEARRVVVDIADGHRHGCGGGESKRPGIGHRHLQVEVGHLK